MSDHVIEYFEECSHKETNMFVNNFRDMYVKLRASFIISCIVP